MSQARAECSACIQITEPQCESTRKPQGSVKEEKKRERERDGVHVRESFESKIFPKMGRRKAVTWNSQSITLISSVSPTSLLEDGHN